MENLKNAIMKYYKFLQVKNKNMKATLAMSFLCIYHYFWINLMIVLVPTLLPEKQDKHNI